DFSATAARLVAQAGEFEAGVIALGGDAVHPPGGSLAVAVGAGAADGADPGHLMLLVVSWPRRAAADGGGVRRRVSGPAGGPGGGRGRTCRGGSPGRPGRSRPCCS